MCRILFLKGSNKKKAIEYIDALFQAGCNDPFLEDMVNLLEIPKLKNKHIHGWGYLLVTPQSVVTYLNGESFFNDTKGFENLKKMINETQGKFILMAELRVTDIGFVSAFHSHPFYFTSKNGFEGYFFYNGLLDYEKLAELEGINFTHFKNKNGTTLMGHTFSNELEKGSTLQQALLAPIKALKSGYNLMAFISTNTGTYKAILNAFTKEEMIENEVAYKYGSLIKKQDNDLFFAGSNAIGVYLPHTQFESMKNGEYIEFDIDWIEEYYFDAYN